MISRFQFSVCLMLCSAWFLTAVPPAGAVEGAAAEIKAATAEVQPATAEVQAATAEIAPVTPEAKKPAVQVKPKTEKKAAPKPAEPGAPGEDHSSTVKKKNETGDITIDNHGMQAIFINSEVTINGGTISGEMNQETEPAAEEKAEGEEGEEGAKAGAEGAAGARGGKTPPEKPGKYAEIIKDATKSEGLFTLYEKEEKLYFEIKPEQLEKNFLMHGILVTGVGAGGFKPGAFVGDYITDKTVVTFEQVQDKIHLVRKNLRFKATGDPLEQLSVDKNHVDSLIAAIPYEATNPENSAYVIDMSKIVLGDFFQIAEELRASLGIGYSLDPSGTYIKETKALPENIILRTRLSFRSGMNLGTAVLPDSRNVQVETLMDIRPLKDNPEFTPRAADNRIGYFIDAYVDFGNDEKITPFVRNVQRWDIRKASPELDVSPPAKPLVFWLDKTIPDQYRDAVRRGVLEWNKAYEKIGIRDAIQVHDQPKDATWDISDARYNTIHWNTSFEDAYAAVAQFLSDPRTGEILQGGFLIESETIRTALGTLRRRNPDRVTMLKAQFEAPKPERGHNHLMCSYSQGLAEQTMLGYTILAARAGIDNVSDELRKEIVDQMLFAYACHEMGHVLGLRHNFEGSTQISLEQIHNKAVTSEIGLTASIMDYTPMNVSPPGVKQGHYFEQTIGAYDYLAIEYGYKPVASAPPVTPSVAQTKAVTPVVSAAAVEVQSATAEVPSATAEVSSATAEVSSATGEVSSATAEASSAMEAIALATPVLASATGETKTPAVPVPAPVVDEDSDTKAPDPAVEALNQIAEREEIEPYHYGTDEDLYEYGGYDPMVNRFDLGNDPLAYAKYHTQIIRDVMPRLPRLVRQGDDYAFVRDAFDILFLSFYTDSVYAVKYLGGQYVNRVRKGGPNDPPPLVPVSPAKQREALEFLNNVTFSDELFEFDPALLNQLVNDKWSHWGDDTSWSAPHAYPLSSQVSSVYEVLLYYIYSPRTLTRIQDAEKQRSAQAVNFTLPEVFNTLRQGIWREVYQFSENAQAQTAGFTDRTPMVSTYRRMLQRHHLRRMVEMVLEPPMGMPDDARTLAWQSLVELEKQLGAALQYGSVLDAYSQAHLTESHQKIKRALEAKLDVRVDTW